jgi:hypothetical protein
MPKMKLTGICCQIAGTLCLIAGGVALVVAVAFAHDLFTHRPPNSSESDLATCQAHVAEAIGLSLRSWAQDHHDQYPFNVSTNEGGTLELCARGSDGFDSNAWLHFRALSNELADPAFLVCPKDRKHKPARDFQSLRPENVTYRLRTGTNLTQDNAKEVLVVCPLDGNVIYGDCHEDRLPSLVDGWRYATSFRQGVGQILISLGAAALLIGLGCFIKDAHTRSVHD